MNEFQKGDLVRLKSSGPEFTVVEVGDFSNLGGSVVSVKCVRSAKRPNGEWHDVERIYDSALLTRSPVPSEGGEDAISDFPLIDD